MNYKKLKEKRWFRILSNKYVLILLLFGGWMFFFDSNSWLVQHNLNQEIEKLKNDQTYYKEKIEHDKAIIEQLRDSGGLERYAREKYHMKRKNEDVYIIKFQDSTQAD